MKNKIHVQIWLFFFKPYDTFLYKKTSKNCNIMLGVNLVSSEFPICSHIKTEEDVLRIYMFPF